MTMALLRRRCRSQRNLYPSCEQGIALFAKKGQSVDTVYKRADVPSLTAVHHPSGREADGVLEQLGGFALQLRHQLVSILLECMTPGIDGNLVEQHDQRGGGAVLDCGRDIETHDMDELAQRHALSITNSHRSPSMPQQTPSPKFCDTFLAPLIKSLNP